MNELLDAERRLNELQVERAELPAGMAAAAVVGDAPRLSALRARRDTLAVEIEIAAVAVVRSQIEAEQSNHAQLRAALVAAEEELTRRARLAGAAQQEAAHLVGSHNEAHLLAMRLENQVEVSRQRIGELNAQLRRAIKSVATGVAAAPPQVGEHTGRELVGR